jgi:hypothetical protein
VTQPWLLAPEPSLAWRVATTVVLAVAFVMIAVAAVYLSMYLAYGAVVFWKRLHAKKGFRRQ